MSSLAAWAVAATFATSAGASEAIPEGQAALAAAIAAAGRHDYAPKRHAAEIDGCFLKTYVYKPHKGTEQLWSHFTAPLLAVDFGNIRNPRDGRRVTFVRQGDPSEHMVYIFVNMREPNKVLHLKPEYRKTKKPQTWVEPRNGIRYYTQEHDNFFIHYEGGGDPDKAERFITLIEAYRDRYCQFIG